MNTVRFICRIFNYSKSHFTWGLFKMTYIWINTLPCKQHSLMCLGLHVTTWLQHTDYGLRSHTNATLKGTHCTFYFLVFVFINNLCGSTCEPAVFCSVIGGDLVSSVLNRLNLCSCCSEWSSLCFITGSTAVCFYNDSASSSLCCSPQLFWSTSTGQLRGSSFCLDQQHPQ